MSIRVGFGYDVHRLTQGRKLIVGGIDIPSAKGLSGHSDADVLVHAIIDSLLGAAGLRDIGNQFPDTDPQFKDADSCQLLAQVVDLLKIKGFTIGNIDSTLLLEKPKISNYIPLMIRRLSEILQLSEDSISIKATTSEGLGFAGRDEGAAAYAIALITKRSS